MHPAVYVGLVGIWVLLLISAFFSLRSLTITTWSKLLWLLVIIALPVVGLLFYVIRCLLKSNWEGIGFLFHTRRLDAQISASSNQKKNA